MAPSSRELPRSPLRLTGGADGPRPRSLADLISQVTAGRLGPDPAETRVSVAFATRQGVRHASRGSGYRNHVISFRVDRAVGSCAVEPDEVPDDLVYDCVGASVADLVAHPVNAVRVAALDAYLMAAHPHERFADEAVTVPAGSSLEKSMARAALVTDLVPASRGQTVLVVGVVNSLLSHLRRRGLRYVPCDLKDGATEWGEPFVPDCMAVVDRCDAVLASGMTLGNGTFEPLLRHARRTGKPFVVFAQTGSAVLPWFLGSGVTAVSAEPYPFFWLDGGPSVLYRYGGKAS
ncbi:Rossmann-like domain-containing protein [Streptoalloteichus tenebrarius]|uniref:Rossmann-like domain-containing protein n=1 Tax=Streptoalloteichus tenebrarius (strain ATCC 17920 / DSM 40477 / JCM 4838 / CBS 697.72 / NBRC 16177 / NCIMB 11028 / NRRL B-12390 / A12253. 1 / ISP 5477) TaxID=1933 RepID=UPI0020A2E382|nr:DUF364 domain-containing protein [Streptoalloteichus tenebrarius]